MMMMIKRYLLILYLIASALDAFPQEKDFGIWYSINAEVKLIKKLELDISPNVRTFHNGSKIQEAFLDAGLTYKVIKYLSFSASYRITEHLEDDNLYHLQHKLFLDAKGSWSPGDLSLSGRIRYQRRYKTFIEDEEDEIPDSHIRLRLKALYDIPSFKFNPFVSAELFCPIFKEFDRMADKKRFMFGFEYSVNKIHSFDIAYIFQRDYHPDLFDENIISINYSLKF
jgi:hypothetical protein